MAFKMNGYDSGVSAFNKNGPTDSDKAKMKKLMERFKNATDPQDKLRIKNQMEELAGV